MINLHLLGIGANLLDKVRRIHSQDWFILYEGFLDIGRRLLLTLMGLNRVWAFTDNPDFTGLKSFVDGLAWQPDHFVDRLGQLLQSNTTVSVLGFVDIIAEILALVKVHLSTEDISSEREMLKQVRN